jgi:hypothetical protein
MCSSCIGGHANEYNRDDSNQLFERGAKDTGGWSGVLIWLWIQTKMTRKPRAAI